MDDDTKTAEKAAESAADDLDPDMGYQHIVGRFERLIAGVLRLRIPRAMCGVILIGDPDRPEPGPDAPMCPACLARGGTPGKWIPGEWRDTE